MEEIKLDNDSLESVVDSQTEIDKDAGESAAPNSAASEVAAEAKPMQSRADNSAAKSARIQAQQETERKMNEAYDRRIARAGLVNPYTQTPISDQKGLNEYFDRLREERLTEQSKRTGKSLAELEEEEKNREFISDLRKGRKEPSAGMDLVEDVKAFRSAFPDVDPGELEENANFRRFAGSRLYKEPLAQLYGDFLELTGNAGKAAVVKAQSKEDRGTGSGGTGGDVKLSAAQQAELEEWNRANPHLKMTAKEFAGR